MNDKEGKGKRNTDGRRAPGVKRLRRNVTAVACCCVLCLCMNLLMLPVTAEAETVTDTLTIKIGYWGMSEKEYVTKTEFHWTDLRDMYGGLDAMPELAYTYFKGRDSGSYKIVVVAARGALLRDVLDRAGLNMSDVTNISFYTNDYQAGAFASFTPYQLLQEPRYYYYDLAAHINNEYNDLGILTGYEVDPSAESFREAVPTMLALESNWSEFEAGAVNTDPVFSGMMTSSRFRLLFGQNAADETNMTGKSAKYVHTIALTIPGAPEVKPTGGTSGRIMLSTQIGRHTTTFNVASDEAMLASIMEKIEWTSSDDSVLRIDNVQMGRSTEYDDAVTVQIDYEVLKEGNATINGNYMGMQLTGSRIETDPSAGGGQSNNNNGNISNNNGNNDAKSSGKSKAERSGKSSGGNGSGSSKKNNSGSADNRNAVNSTKKSADRKLSLTDKGGTVKAMADPVAAPAPAAQDSGLVAMDLESIFEAEDQTAPIIKKDNSGRYVPFIGAGVGTMILLGGAASALQFRSELGDMGMRLRRRKM